MLPWRAKVAVVFVNGTRLKRAKTLLPDAASARPVWDPPEVIGEDERRRSAKLVERLWPKRKGRRRSGS